LTLESDLASRSMAYCSLADSVTFFFTAFTG
jgi:hypothetical protein